MSKIKLAYDIGRIVASQLVSGRLQRTTQPRAARLRLGQGRVITTTRRRRRNNRAGKSALEVNHAEGGRKSNVQTGAFRTLTVDSYGRIVLVKEQSIVPEESGYSARMQLAVENFANTYNYLDVVTNLNLAPEFQRWRDNAIKYKVLSVSFTFNYTRVPESNDKIAKLLLWFDTDLAEVKAPLLETTVMKLDMSKPGTKNYGIVLNRRNMKPDHVDWFNATDDYTGTVYLNIGSQDVNYLNDSSVQVQLLGSFKMSINVALVLKDLSTDNGLKILNKTIFGGNKEQMLQLLKKKEDEKEEEEEVISNIRKIKLEDPKSAE